jgi:hypothetical protein
VQSIPGCRRNERAGRASSDTTLHIEKRCLVAISYTRFIVRLCHAPACNKSQPSNRRVGNVLAKPKPLDRLSRCFQVRSRALSGDT